MTLQIRTFRIPEPAGSGSPGADQERAVAAFLRSVKVERIETAYTDRAWSLLVLYHDRKDQEEAAQIASAVASALREWRSETAARDKVKAEKVLRDALLERVALAVPTTTLELAELQNGGSDDSMAYAGEIVQVVRSALAELT